MLLCERSGQAGLRFDGRAGHRTLCRKRAATQWVKLGIIGRVKHLRGEEDLQHASLQDFRGE
jgi:bifunctional non-homologous end joining protein LigD